MVFFSIIRHLSREPDFSAKNRIFKNFLKCLKACLVCVFWVFQSIFSIVRHLGREPDFLSREPDFQKFLEKPQNIFMVFLHYSTSEPRTGFFSQESDFQKFLKMPQSVFSWCFLSVSKYFSIVRHLGREPDFWAENRIFTNFLKSHKTCLVGVFWVFQGIFRSREPDVWAENRIFKNFFKNLKTCCCFLSVSRYLTLFEIWAENRIFQPRTGFSKISQKASKRV